MSKGGPIRKVAVFGGGITASSAAAALKKRLPMLDVQLVETPPAPDALADRIISTLPSISAFHESIGLADADTLSGAGSGLRLGTLFSGWAGQRPDYVHAYGDCGAAVGTVPFHQLWLRDLAPAGETCIERFSAAATIAASGNSSLIGSQPFGLQLTLERYAQLMRAYAIHLNVHVQNGVVRQVNLRDADRFIDEVELDNGGQISADLFVDCTGPSSPFQQRLETPFIDWSSWLHCDSVAMEAAAPQSDAVMLDRATTRSAGWHWQSSSPQKSSRGFVYASAHTAADEHGASSDPIVLRQGRRRDFWVGNCVALGDAAVTVEPLEWTNLHLVHSQLDRLISMMPGRDCAPLELKIFNNECAAEADRVRDFLCMHYLCSDRPEPFWQDAASMTPPDSLQHTLSLFRERGRLPYYQEETFQRDSWLTVLIGQGVRSRRIDPLADLVSPEEAAQAFAAMRRSLQAFCPPVASAAFELNPHGIR